MTINLKMGKQNIARIIFGVIMVILILTGFFLKRSGYFSPDVLFQFLAQYPVLAPILFIVIYSITLCLLIPSAPLTIGSGFLWGPFWGVILSMAGATLGCSFGFLIARYLAGDYFRKKLNNSTWRWLLDKIDKSGRKVVGFARINPVFPSALFSYLFGVTSIPFVTYLWATFVFMLPPCIAYVAFGSSIEHFMMTGSFKGVATGVIIAIPAFILMFLGKRFAQKMFPEKKELKAQG